MTDSSSKAGVVFIFLPTHGCLRVGLINALDWGVRRLARTRGNGIGFRTPLAWRCARADACLGGSVQPTFPAARYERRPVQPAHPVPMGSTRTPSDGPRSDTGKRPTERVARGSRLILVSSAALCLFAGCGDSNELPARATNAKQPATPLKVGTDRRSKVTFILRGNLLKVSAGADAPAQVLSRLRSQRLQYVCAASIGLEPKAARADRQQPFDRRGLTGTARLSGDTSRASFCLIFGYRYGDIAIAPMRVLDGRQDAQTDCGANIKREDLSLQSTESVAVLGCKRTASGRPFAAVAFSGGRFAKEPCMVLTFPKEPVTGLQDCQRPGPPKKGAIALAGPKNERLKGADLYEAAVSERVAAVVVTYTHRRKVSRREAALVRSPDPPSELKASAGFGLSVVEVPRGSTAVTMSAVDSHGTVLGSVRPDTRSRGFGPL